MPRITFSVPMMYADHHVLRVRDALSALHGVTDITASAAAKQVAVEGTDSITPEAIERVLTEAGYPPNQDLPMSRTIKGTEDGSSWYTLVQRVTVTERKDLEAAGDFRKY